MSECANRLWVTKIISIISQFPQEMPVPKQSETKKKPKTKIVDNDDMTQWTINSSKLTSGVWTGQ